MGHVLLNEYLDRRLPGDDGCPVFFVPMPMEFCNPGAIV
jgi:hypothetical protein